MRRKARQTRPKERGSTAEKSASGWRWKSVAPRRKAYPARSDGHGIEQKNVARLEEHGIAEKSGAGQEECGIAAEKRGRK